MYSTKIGGLNFSLTSPTQKELDAIPEDKFNEIGNRIKHLRKDRKITQEDMAKALFRTSQAYGNIESGKVKHLTVKDINTICEKLNTTYHYLLGLTDDPAYGRTVGYCLSNNTTCKKVTENPYGEYCTECKKIFARSICFKREVDSYEGEISIIQDGNEILKKDINSDRRNIIEYIKSCSGDVIILTGGKSLIINSNTLDFTKIRYFHGNISIVNHNKIEYFKDIDKEREELIEFLLNLDGFAKMTVTKSGREIDYTIFLNDDGTAIYLRDERNLGNMIAPANFKSDKPETAESDSKEFHKALHKIIFDTNYHSTDGLFILDEFIRVMDVEPSQRELLKKELSVLIDKYSKRT